MADKQTSIPLTVSTAFEALTFTQETALDNQLRAIAIELGFNSVRHFELAAKSALLAYGKPILAAQQKVRQVAESLTVKA